MSMFLLEGSSHRSCNLASECTHVCWLVWVGVCAFLCVGWYVPPVRTLPRKTEGVQKRAPLPPEPSRVRPYHAFAALETKSDDLSTQNPRVQRRAPLPPEPSRVRPCHGFAALEAKSDDLSTQNPRVQKRAPLPPEFSRVRPCHGFAPLETKSDDPRAATARAL